MAARSSSVKPTLLELSSAVLVEGFLAVFFSDFIDLPSSGVSAGALLPAG
jgi:hypothetical protein